MRQENLFKCCTELEKLYQTPLQLLPTRVYESKSSRLAVGTWLLKDGFSFPIAACVSSSSHLECEEFKDCFAKYFYLSTECLRLVSSSTPMYDVKPLALLCKRDK